MLIKRLLLIGALLMLLSRSFLHADSPEDKQLTSRISDIIRECAKLKAGITRAELMKHFAGEGGIYFPERRTFVYQTCPYIKVDVVFTLANPKVREESPQDVVETISKPYLELSISD